jgi:hypothetical protein
MRSSRVCPWGCQGSKGEIAVVRAERTSVPDAPSTARLVRCRECRGISIVGRVTVVTLFERTQHVECRIPLGRFDGSVWVPASPTVRRLILRHPFRTVAWQLVRGALRRRLAALRRRGAFMP